MDKTGEGKCWKTEARLSLPLLLEEFSFLCQYKHVQLFNTAWPLPHLRGLTNGQNDHNCHSKTSCSQELAITLLTVPETRASV